MKRKKFIKLISIFLLTEVLCFPHFVFADSLSGTYTITLGLNPSKTTYKGTVDITDIAQTYKLIWKIPVSPVYGGIGIIIDNILCVGWSSGGDYGVVVYKVEGGNLKGKWAILGSDAIGSEDLEGPAGLNGVYKIVNSFSPQKGQGYMGTVTINKNGEVYLVNWTLPSESYSGIGILEDNLLIVGWGVGHYVGVVYYRIKDGTLLGRWAIPEETKIGIENLLKTP